MTAASRIWEELSRISKSRCRGRGSVQLERTNSQCRRLLSSLAARRVHPPGDTDANHVEAQHGNRVDAHCPRIGTGTDHGRDEEDCEYGIANVLPQELGADDPEHGQEEDED